MSYTLLPIVWGPNNSTFNRLIVKPTKFNRSETAGGLLRPERESEFHEIGMVMSTCENSEFNIGDTVYYNKIDRSSGEHIDTIEYEGVTCDAIFENEIWFRNGQPVKRIFVEMKEGMEISEGGLHIHAGTKGLTAKGVVFAAPEEYMIPTGASVEFRYPEHGIFHKVEIDGKHYIVLFEADVFVVDGKAAPNRIIVKIDMLQQERKRIATPAGLVLSPLFLAMLHNLQYAEISAIGAEAQKMYPSLKAGDEVIIHHTIEHQPYRLISKEYGKHAAEDGSRKVLYEYRAINCFDKNSREIFAKARFDKKTRKIKDIFPVNQNIFLKWEFRLLDSEAGANSTLLSDVPTEYNCNDLDKLRSLMEGKRRVAAEKAKLRLQGISNAINNTLDPQYRGELMLQAASVQAEETRLSAHLRRNYLVVCEQIAPHPEGAKYVVAPYEQLYPITIQGQRYLIADQEFIFAQTTKHMNFTIKDFKPIGDNVIVLPIEEEKTSDLIIPTSAKEAPQKGLVIASSDHPEIKEGCTVLFRKQAGLEQEVEGKKYLILKTNDIIAVANTPQP